MISTDRSLLGERVGASDAVSRHRQYSQYVDKLDIIILSRQKYSTKSLAGNVFCYPTNSRGFLFYPFDIYKIASELYKEGNYDLIVCQDPFIGLVGVFLKNKFKTKLLVHFHGDFWQNKYWLREHPMNFFLLLISKLVVRRADYLRVVSGGIRDKLIKSGINSKKIKVIPTPVDLSKFQTPDNETVASIKNEFNNKKILLYVGRLTIEKNLIFLLKVFKKIRKKYQDVVLLLAGGGRDHDKIARAILELELGDSVKMLGPVGYQNLVNYYHACDIVVLPSRHESFGKVLLEAGACAKPACSSNTTAAKTNIKDGFTGLLSPVNNQTAFATNVLKLLTNEELSNKLGSAAFEYVTTNFNFSDNIKQVVDYWGEIVEG